MDVRGIVFDLDGTLIDSARDLAASVNYTLKRMELAERSLEEITGFVGDGVQKLIIRSLGDSHQDLQDEALMIFMDHYGQHLVDTTVLYTGVMNTLKMLHQSYPLAVLTNKSERFTINILEALGVIQYFEAVFGGDTLPVKKPDPAALLLLSDKWSMPVSKMLMVGDHVTDIQVGINGGCKTVFFANGMGQTKGLVPDIVIQSLEEILKIVTEHEP